MALCCVLYAVCTQRHNATGRIVIACCLRSCSLGLSSAARRLRGCGGAGGRDSGGLRLLGLNKRVKAIYMPHLYYINYFGDEGAC
ncbi:hypothetical protein NDU88_002927 [Pleurodeles waltl]|uniref:Secreted protein n=1 Tax=Pleurodeles waltl TaxID=8319 RepID=A0AAV7LFG4_PLEWA|nr:hypothetical protein NDU88_002927 [Pleurodeles waltl]